MRHVPEDMTVTTDATITLPELQAELAKHGQWLPVDPPGTPSIRDVLENNLSGSHRYGYGTIREHLLGITVRLADGRTIKAGGQVVKNVAGYDLCKLFVGSRGTLGTITEATFKLQPLPEAREFLSIRCNSLTRAEQILERIVTSELTPVVLDLHNLGGLQLVVGLGGARENVAWHVEQLRDLNPQPLTGLNYPPAWEHSRSVLPSKLTATIAELNPTEFLAHAGNGILHYRGGPPPAKPVIPVELVRRVKDAFDPRHLLPEFPQ